VAWLTKKWERENGYRLRKELFSFTDNKVSAIRDRSRQIKKGTQLTRDTDRGPILVRMVRYRGSMVAHLWA